MILVILLYIINLLVGYFTIRRARRLYKTYWNHYFFYNASWLVLIFLSLFFNNYLTRVQPFTYIIFLLQLIFFNFSIIFIKPSVSKIEVKDVTLNINKRRILEIVVLLCLAPQAIVNLTLIRAGIPLYKINYEYWTEVRTSGSYLYAQFKELLLFPLALILIASIFYDKYNKYTKLDYIITIVMGSLIAGCYFLISGGGRSEVMILFFVLILSYLARNVQEIKNDIKIPSKFIIIILSIILIIVIQFANEGRGKEGNIIQNAIEGYIIFAPLFEYYLNSDIMFNYTYGASMCEAIILIMQLPFKLFGLTLYDVTINDIIQQFVYLPQYAKEYNNQVSACFVYMRDFGYLGIVIGPIITAFIYNFIYKICRHNSFMYLIYFTYVMRLCGTNLNFQINKVFIFAIIYAFIISKIYKVKKNAKSRISSSTLKQHE